MKAGRGIRKRAVLFFKAKGRCHYCRVPLRFPRPNEDQSDPRMTTREHIVPRAAASGLHRNTVAACLRCNQLKMHIPYEKFVSSRAWEFPPEQYRLFLRQQRAAMYGDLPVLRHLGGLCLLSGCEAAGSEKPRPRRARQAPYRPRPEADPVAGQEVKVSAMSTSVTSREEFLRITRVDDGN